MNGEPWIETATGGRFYIENPEFKLADIAHALGHLCRFGGHSKQFYSVAEHSVLVAQITMDFNLGDPFEALMHDAHEAYLCDLPKPWKDVLPEYRQLEARIAAPLRTWARLPVELSPGVKRADQLALHIEAMQLMQSKAEGWAGDPEIIAEAKDMPYKIRCFSPTFAKSQFWHRYNELEAARQTA